MNTVTYTCAHDWILEREFVDVGPDWYGRWRQEQWAVVLCVKCGEINNRVRIV